MVHSASVSSPSHVTVRFSLFESQFRLSKKCSKLADSGHMLSLINFFLPFTSLQCVFFFCGSLASTGRSWETSQAHPCNSAVFGLIKEQSAYSFYVKIVLNFATQSTTDLSAAHLHICFFSVSLSYAQSNNYFPSLKVPQACQFVLLLLGFSRPLHLCMSQL